MNGETNFHSYDLLIGVIVYGMRKSFVLLLHFLVLVFCFVGFTCSCCVQFSESHCVWCIVNYCCDWCARLADHYCMRLTMIKHLQLLFHVSVSFSRFNVFLYGWCVFYNAGHCVWCTEVVNFCLFRCFRFTGHYCVKHKAYMASNVILLLGTCPVIEWLLLLK